MGQSRDNLIYKKKRKLRPEFKIILIGSLLLFFFMAYFVSSLILKAEDRSYQDPLARINSADELNDKTKEALALFLRIAKDKGLNVMVTETYRTQERQDYLYSLGRTVEGSVVTWTKNSMHTKRNAFDIAKNVAGHEYDDVDFFRQCAEIAKSIGLEAGYYWEKGQQDMPHFQMTTFGKVIIQKGIRKMKTKIDERKTALKKKSKGTKILRIFIAMVFLLGFLYYENNAVDISHYVVDNIKIPVEFDGVKILQISDLHSKSFGKNQKRLIEIVKNLKPDYIFLTGDLIDYRSNLIEPCADLIRGIKDVGPIYFVTGNHEEASKVYLTFKQMLQDNGVIILDDESAVIKKGEGKILVSGISDREVLHYSNSGKSEEFRETLNSLARNHDMYQILLAHRPELIDYYSEANFDLVFSGHAHGGQVRLPFLGGLVAPGQGLFPKYTENVHVVGNTSMVISRGLGNSLIPQRLFNPPEIVVVTLKSSAH